MARILGLLPSALEAARNGISYTQWAKLIQQAGLGARSSEMGKLYRAAVAMVNAAGDDIFRPLNRVPTPDEITPWPTRNATGIRQQVTLVYRNTVTGTVSTVPYSAYSQNGVTREEAIARAVAAYSTNDARYLQQLIGAVHAGTYQYVPFESAD